MQTIRIISNISYNTIDHFIGVIIDLERRGIIDWCYWIVHQPDTDETKVHIHFVLKPSKRLDTQALYKEFLEIDKTNPLPLGCTKKWNYTNNISDWLLYAVHDTAYLMSKGQFRNIAYKFDDIGATDYDALRMDWNAIDRTKFERLWYLEKAVEDQVPFAQLVQQGVVPIAQRSQYEAQYKALWSLYIAKQNGECGRVQSHEEQEPDPTDGPMEPVWDRTVDLMDIDDMSSFIKDNQLEF